MSQAALRQRCSRSVRRLTEAVGVQVMTGDIPVAHRPPRSISAAVLSDTPGKSSVEQTWYSIR